MSINIPDLSDGNNKLTNDTITIIADVTDNNGCEAPDTIGIRIIPLPEPNIDNTTVCPNMDYTVKPRITDSLYYPYTFEWEHDNSEIWKFNFNNSSTTQTHTGPDLPFTNLQKNVYVKIEVTDKYGCASKDSAFVEVNKNLTVKIVGDSIKERCANDGAIKLESQYNASDGYLFAWINDKDKNDTLYTTESLPNFADSGKYELYVYNTDGCEGRDNVEINIFPIPTMTADPKSICEEEAVTIGVTAETGDFNSISYAWDISPDPGTREISVNTGGSYKETVTTTYNHPVISGQKLECQNDTTFLITENLNPQPDIEGGTICDGDTLILSDLNDKKMTASFKWNENNNLDSTAFLASTAGKYKLEVVDTNGCEGADSTDIIVIPIPVVDLGEDTIRLCEGDSKAVDAENDGKTISWNTSQTTSEISVNQTGKYVVTVSDNGCPSKDSVYVNVVALPVSQLNKALGDGLICFEELERPITIDAGYNKDYTYEWGGTLETTSSINIDEAKTYFVKISVDVGDGQQECSITDGIQFKNYCPPTIYVPNAFTPDGDTQNDEFYAEGMYLDDYEMYIYNRWGELIFTSKNQDEGWDGTYMNNECQIDVYVWKIYYSVESPDGSGHRIKKQKSGRVSLLR